MSIKIEKTEVVGWKAAIRGMRNPMNSWEKSDSVFNIHYAEMNNGFYGERLKGYDKVSDLLGDYWDNLDWDGYPTVIGPNDHKLMMQLAKAGTTHSKYRRMINVYCDITAPLYWWKEFDTYKVGTVANSCSTMHKIAAKEFTFEDFSTDQLLEIKDYIKELDMATPDPEFPMVKWYKASDNPDEYWVSFTPNGVMTIIVEMLNCCRDLYLNTNDKKYWWQMIQLLPSSYNQKRTVMMNYEVLAGIYPNRKDHKLDEWHDFCDWIRELPYSELITLEEEEAV